MIRRPYKNRKFGKARKSQLHNRFIPTGVPIGKGAPSAVPQNVKAAKPAWHYLKGKLSPVLAGKARLEKDIRNGRRGWIYGNRMSYKSGLINFPRRGKNKTRNRGGH